MKNYAENDNTKRKEIIKDQFSLNRNQKIILVTALIAFTISCVFVPVGYHTRQGAVIFAGNWSFVFGEWSPKALHFKALFSEWVIIAVLFKGSQILARDNKGKDR